MIRFGSLAVAAAAIAGALTFADALAGEAKPVQTGIRTADAAPAPAPVAAEPAIGSTIGASRSETCTRKVKVVYGGLGEAQRAGCAVASN
jgi:hypothetical protein